MAICTPPSSRSRLSGRSPSEVAVVVAEHGVGLGQRLQLGQRLSGRDVTGVEDDVGPGHRIEHLGADAVDPFGEVAVGQDDHLHREEAWRTVSAAGSTDGAGAPDGRIQTPTAPKESCMAAAAPRRWSNVVVISGSTRRVTAHM